MIDNGKFFIDPKSNQYLVLSFQNLWKDGLKITWMLDLIVLALVRETEAHIVFFPDIANTPAEGIIMISELCNIIILLLCKICVLIVDWSPLRLFLYPLKAIWV